MKMTFKEKVEAYLFKVVVWRAPFSQQTNYSKVIKIHDDYLIVKCGLFTEGIKPEWIIHVSSYDVH